MTTNGQSPFVTLFLVLRENDPYIEENAAIIHYCGSNKPWKKNYIGVLDCFYHEVADAQ